MLTALKDRLSEQLDTDEPDSGVNIDDNAVSIRVQDVTIASKMNGTTDHVSRSSALTRLQPSGPPVSLRFASSFASLRVPKAGRPAEYTQSVGREHEYATSQSPTVWTTHTCREEEDRRHRRMQRRPEPSRSISPLIL